MSNAPEAKQLISIVERIEHVEAEIADLNASKAEIYSESKSSGFDTKILKRVVAYRRKDKAQRESESEIFDLYLSAIEGSSL